MTFYLKYRPQTLDDLIGQESVKKIIFGGFAEDRLSHAYLFAGPRGTGKTSTARILAKMVNCENNVILGSEATPESKKDSGQARMTNNAPCNKCSTCLSITDGSNLDLIEIDAASNRGIEDIRSLREKIKLAPSGNKKKVYIIDEVHMLTTEAFNALLKTLEEPPSHALFILATTDAGKLPQTILSRVQRLDFKLATPPELMQALEKIIKQEKIDIDGEALNLLVKKSDGSFRDGVKLLDQLSSLGEKITLEILQTSLKSSNFDDILDLIESFSRKDTRSSLSLILKQVENGIDVKSVILSLMDTLRNLVFIKNGLGGELVKPYLVEAKYEILIKLADSFSSMDLVKNLSLLQNSLEKLKVASIPSLPLELAVVEICGEQQTMEDRKSKIEVDNRELKIEKKEIHILPSTIHNLSSESVDSPDIIKLKEKWTFVLETIRPYNFSLEALLRSINITECSDTTIIMEVPYSFHQRILEAPKNRDLLESILSDILGRSIQISTVLGSRPARKEDIANIEMAEDDEIIRAAAEIFNSDTIN